MTKLQLRAKLRNVPKQDKDEIIEWFDLIRSELRDARERIAEMEK